MYVILMSLNIQVFLPLLVQYFTEPELKKLTRDVIELHHLNDSGITTQSVLLTLCVHIYILCIYIYYVCMYLKST